MDFNEFENRMEKTIEVFKQNLSEVRAGRANPAILNKISYLDVLNKDLKVMDSTATALCKDNNIPILVFGIAEPENMVKAVMGENVGTLVE